MGARVPSGGAAARGARPRRRPPRGVGGAPEGRPAFWLEPFVLRRGVGRVGGLGGRACGVDGDALGEGARGEDRGLRALSRALSGRRVARARARRRARGARARYSQRVGVHAPRRRGGSGARSHFGGTSGAGWKEQLEGALHRARRGGARRHRSRLRPQGATGGQRE